jgi:hypothetical protein
MLTQFKVNLITIACCLSFLTACATTPVPSAAPATPPRLPSKLQGVEDPNRPIPEVFESSQPLPVRKTPESADEATVRGRAQTRWDLLIAKKLQDAYGYISPSYTKLIPYSIYAAGINSDAWRKANVAQALCTPEVCEVFVNVGVKISVGRLGLVDHESLVREKWIRTNGQWWFVPGAQ